VPLPSPIPTATYRLQFNRNFTFRDAAAIVPYLSALGISHCYASPYLRARPGSLHGYDIIDHNALNPEIGTPEDYEHFVAELHRHGMGQILDIVPNHMGVMGSDNTWWLDVLENGEASEYADFFDIDWDPVKDELQGKVLIPILGDQYGNELDQGKLQLTFDPAAGSFSIFYHEHRFPVDPVEYARILGFHNERLKDQLGATHDDILELQSASTAFSHLPGRRGLSPEQRAERNREKEVQKKRLIALYERSEEIRSFIATNVASFNGNVEDPHSFENLHELIKTQAYRLAQWRVAADDINYRRFFDINDLAALCMENEVVFNATHRFILDLVAQGKADGLRIDHPDGLYDPFGYLQRLRDKLLVDTGGANKSVYLVVEKILTGSERLSKDWPVHGTTGYEFTNLVNGLFVDQSASGKMERIYRSFSGRSFTSPSFTGRSSMGTTREQALEFSEIAYFCKKLILKVGLASELNVLANLLSRIALANRHTCDFTLNSLRSALAEIIASFPVYRTYIRDSQINDEDRRYVIRAVSAARKRSNAADLSVFDFVQRILLVETNGAEPGWYTRAVLRFSMKFQQVTSAVMAKGLEDTAFYRYFPLVSLNEVGGNPVKFGVSIDEFHRANQERFASWPHSMLSSSTHDSKRSEDVRARINVLSEMPAAWRLRLRHWREWNRNKKRLIEDQLSPTHNDEYLLYQTLVGMWPEKSLGNDSLDEAEAKQFSERIEQYMLKAVREAKEHTSWANTNEEYEGALLSFIRAILERNESNQFLTDFADFHKRVARAGIFNSLSQCLLKLTVPGVPDIYQGNEFYDFSLVDPDNRRQVDYRTREAALEELQSHTASSQISIELLRSLVSYPENGSLKLYLTWKTLGLRAKEATLFREGQYKPLAVSGQKSQHVVAFAREHEGKTAIVAVPRLCAALLGEKYDTICNHEACGDEVWGDTRLEVAIPNGACYHNVFTGECMHTEADEGKNGVSVARLFSHFPAALLMSSPSACA
jgi:(1->4)-alpha-D-glucan 1-alpha-D-glucosylmutase